MIVLGQEWCSIRKIIFSQDPIIAVGRIQTEGIPTLFASYEKLTETDR